MKKLLIALLTAMVVFGFTACNPSTPGVTVTGEDELIESLMLRLQLARRQ